MNPIKSAAQALTRAVSYVVAADGLATSDIPKLVELPQVTPYSALPVDDEAAIAALEKDLAHVRDYISALPSESTVQQLFAELTALRAKEQRDRAPLGAEEVRRMERLKAFVNDNPSGLASRAEAMRAEIARNIDATQQRLSSEAHLKAAIARRRAAENAESAAGSELRKLTDAADRVDGTVQALREEQASQQAILDELLADATVRGVDLSALAVDPTARPAGVAAVVPPELEKIAEIRASIATRLARIKESEGIRRALQPRIDAAQAALAEAQKHTLSAANQVGAAEGVRRQALVRQAVVGALQAISARAPGGDGGFYLVVKSLLEPELMKAASNPSAGGRV